MQALSGALAEAIGVGTRNRDAQKLHQEKEAEEERQHQTKLDKVASRRL